MVQRCMKIDNDCRNIVKTVKLMFRTDKQKEDLSQKKRDEDNPETQINSKFQRGKGHYPLCPLDPPLVEYSVKVALLDETFSEVQYIWTITVYNTNTSA